MKIITILLGTLTSILVTACSKSTVVLVESGKSHNAIVVATDKGVATLDKVGTFVELRDKEAQPSKIQTISPEEIKRRFGATLAAEPPKAAKFILYFDLNSTTLNEQSLKVLNEALKTIELRSPCMVDIIGHTDTIGSRKENLKVSKKRAETIKKMIMAKGKDIKSLSVKGYGEEDLLVSTADNVAEARNRNVEIFIK